MISLVMYRLLDPSNFFIGSQTMDQSGISGTLSILITAVRGSHSSDLVNGKIAAT